MRLEFTGAKPSNIQKKICEQESEKLKSY